MDLPSPQNHNAVARAPSRPPLVVIIGLILAIVFDTVLQLVWKVAVVSIPEDASFGAMLSFVFANPLFLAVVAVMAIQFFNWLVVLASADLSYAQPLTSLSYVTVLVISVEMLGEKADAFQFAGIVLILLGTYYISQTPHRTDRAGDPK